MDFKEYLVKRRLRLAEKTVIALLYLSALLFAMCCFMYLGKYLGGIENLLIVGGFYLAYILSAKLKKEFEYTIVEDSVDIDVIFNESKRKSLISFSVKNIEVMASMKDVNHNDRLKEHFDRVIDASTWKKDANVYFVILESKGKTIIKFEPSLSCLEYMKKYAPDKIHIYDTDDDGEFE